MEIWTNVVLLRNMSTLYRIYKTAQQARPRSYSLGSLTFCSCLSFSAGISVSRSYCLSVCLSVFLFVGFTANHLSVCCLPPPSRPSPFHPALIKFRVCLCACVF